MAMPAARPLPKSWSCEKPGDHDVAEAAAADEAADDDHGEHVEQTLVGGQHEGLARHRQLHLGDHLPGVLPLERAASTVVGATPRIPSATSLVAIGTAYASAATIAVKRPTPNSASAGTR